MDAYLISDEDQVRILDAIDFWIRSKGDQLDATQASGRAQGGNRGAVTGGRHLAGVNQLIVDELDRLGLHDLDLKFDRGAVLPGFYRSTKAWDLLAIWRGEPVLAVEYKSMTGSEGRNMNNRADEAFGIAEDLSQARSRGLVNPDLRTAYIFLMEETSATTRPVRLERAAGHIDPVFSGLTYMDRMAIMCHRVRETGLYDLTWAVGVRREPLDFFEPDPSVGWAEFKAGLARAAGNWR
ncbi:type II restriction endonuclease [Knoellia sinensis KCTC 19936]|uniref:Type II restriction endonuclease n=1 Tax=Knoellia sinensis KCTC 19936 TaxID=1385520 RepID=A0A0A0J790_9MICO|nr:PaeR7I family type II restriction endonuclease [Knoellia sinensis]KGN31466.1 type II restriction endonuclease [Knoellia sinensis KCTC 19936]